MNNYSIHVAGAALNQTAIDWQNNLANIREAIHRAKEQDVDLLCLPELCITGYGCEDLFLSEWIYTKSMELLHELIEDTANIAVCIGLPVRHGGTTYNCVCIVENKQILGFSAKQFLAGDGVHYEPRWFTPWPCEKQAEITPNGQTYPFGDLTYTIKGHTVGIEICEDAWREERPAKRLVKRGVDIIINPSASHFAFHKSDFRYNLVKESARKYKCLYVYANLLGNETGRMIFDGEVLMATPEGVIVRNELLSFRNVELLTNQQPSCAGLNEKRQDFVDAVTLALFDYLRKSRSKAFVLSLSGGADSSTCAVLVYLMIKRGIDQLGFDGFCKKAGITPAPKAPKDITSLTKTLLITAYQGTENSSAATQEAAAYLAKWLGATFYNWTIDDAVNFYTTTIETQIGRQLTWEQDDITLQNIQARSRSPIIWMLANIFNGLLIATANRSEGDVGYTTMDGDTSGGISPIAGVDKPFILQWMKWAEKTYQVEGLSKVNNLTPMAELRPQEQSQTDEDDLMPYQILVSIERQAIGKYQSPKEVYEHLKITFSDYTAEQLKAFVHRFYTLWSRNQWKRERLAPSFHLDDFNIDSRTWFRFPILSGGYREELRKL